MSSNCYQGVVGNIIKCAKVAWNKASGPLKNLIGVKITHPFDVGLNIAKKSTAICKPIC